MRRIHFKHLMHLFHQIQGSKQWSRGKLGGVLKGNALESRLRSLRFAKILFSLYSGVEMGDSKLSENFMKC